MARLIAIISFFCLSLLAPDPQVPTPGQPTDSGEFDEPPPRTERVLTPEQTRLRGEFRTALNVLLERGPRNHANTNLMRATRAWLNANEVAHSILDVDGASAVRFTPLANGSLLNRFAYANFVQFGTNTIYSPVVLGGADALYRARYNELLISNDAVLGLTVTSHEIHERLHARFGALAQQGVLTPYHCEFISPEGRTPLTSDLGYQRFLSAEEISTYTNETTRTLSNLQGVLRRGLSLSSEEAREAHIGALTRSSMGADIAKASADLSHSALAALDQEGASVKIVSIRVGENNIVGLDITVSDGRTVRMYLLSQAEGLDLFNRVRAANPTLSSPDDLSRAMLPELKELAKSRLRKLAEISTLAHLELTTIQQLLEGLSVEKTNQAIARAKNLNMIINSRENIGLPPIPPGRRVAPAQMPSIPGNPLNGLSEHPPGRSNVPAGLRSLPGNPLQGIPANPSGVAPLSRGSRRYTPPANPDFNHADFEGMQSRVTRPAARPVRGGESLRQTARQFSRDVFNFSRMPVVRQQMVIRAGGPVSVGLTMVGIAEMYKIVGYRLEILHQQMERDKRLCEQKVFERKKGAWERELHKRWSCGATEGGDHPKIRETLKKVGQDYWDEYTAQLRESGKPVPQPSDSEYAKAGNAFLSILFLVSYLGVEPDGTMKFPGACQYVTFDLPRSWYSMNPIRAADTLIDFSRTPPAYYNLRTRRYEPTSRENLEQDGSRARNWPSNLNHFTEQATRLNAAKELEAIDCRTDNRTEDQKYCDDFIPAFRRYWNTLQTAIADCRQGKLFSNQNAVESAISHMHFESLILRGKCPAFEQERSQIMSGLNTLIREGMPAELRIGATSLPGAEERLSQQFRDFCQRLGEPAR